MLVLLLVLVLILVLVLLVLLTHKPILFKMIVILFILLLQSNAQIRLTASKYQVSASSKYYLHLSDTSITSLSLTLPSKLQCLSNCIQRTSQISQQICIGNFLNPQIPQNYSIILVIQVNGSNITQTVQISILEQTLKTFNITPNSNVIGQLTNYTFKGQSNIDFYQSSFIQLITPLYQNSRKQIYDSQTLRCFDMQKDSTEISCKITTTNAIQINNFTSGGKTFQIQINNLKNPVTPQLFGPFQLKILVIPYFISYIKSQSNFSVTTPAQLKVFVNQVGVVGTKQNVSFRLRTPIQLSKNFWLVIVSPWNGKVNEQILFDSQINITESINNTFNIKQLTTYYLVEFTNFQIVMEVQLPNAVMQSNFTFQIKQLSKSICYGSIKIAPTPKAAAVYLASTNKIIQTLTNVTIRIQISDTLPFQNIQIINPLQFQIQSRCTTNVSSLNCSGTSTILINSSQKSIEIYLKDLKNPNFKQTVIFAVSTYQQDQLVHYGTISKEIINKDITLGYELSNKKVSEQSNLKIWAYFEFEQRFQIQIYVNNMKQLIEFSNELSVIQQTQKKVKFELRYVASNISFTISWTNYQSTKIYSDTLVYIYRSQKIIADSALSIGPLQQKQIYFIINSDSYIVSMDAKYTINCSLVSTTTNYNKLSIEGLKLKNCSTTKCQIINDSFTQFKLDADNSSNINLQLYGYNKLISQTSTITIRVYIDSFLSLIGYRELSFQPSTVQFEILSLIQPFDQKNISFKVKSNLSNPQYTSSILQLKQGQGQLISCICSYNDFYQEKQVTVTLKLPYLEKGIIFLAQVWYQKSIVAKGSYFYTNPCSLNCIECQNQKCSKCYQKILNPNTFLCQSDCLKGYYKLNNSTCIQCQVNCAQCIQSRCIKCNPGFKEVANSAICQNRCAQSYYFNSLNENCQQCGMGCKQCQLRNEEVICFECQNGYFMKESVCQVECPLSNCWIVFPFISILGGVIVILLIYYLLKNDVSLIQWTICISGGIQLINLIWMIILDNLYIIPLSLSVILLALFYFYLYKTNFSLIPIPAPQCYLVYQWVPYYWSFCMLNMLLINLSAISVSIVLLLRGGGWIWVSVDCIALQVFSCVVLIVWRVRYNMNVKVSQQTQVSFQEKVMQDKPKKRQMNYLIQKSPKKDDRFKKSSQVKGLKPMKQKKGNHKIQYSMGNINQLTEQQINQVPKPTSFILGRSRSKRKTQDKRKNKKQILCFNKIYYEGYINTKLEKQNLQKNQNPNQQSLQNLQQDIDNLNYNLDIETPTQYNFDNQRIQSYIQNQENNLSENDQQQPSLPDRVIKKRSHNMGKSKGLKKTMKQIYLQRQQTKGIKF